MTESISIEMLTPERVTELWPSTEPLFAQACDSHEIARDDITAESIYKLATQGMCVVFVMFLDDEPACTMAIQFHETNGRRGADIIALAGKRLMVFKKAYWQAILDWLQINGVEFLDAYVPEERAELYQKRFGFQKSCAHVRMNFHRGTDHEQIS